MKLANDIASHVQYAVLVAKQSVRCGIQCDVYTAATYEALTFGTCFVTEEQKDEMKSF